MTPEKLARETANPPGALRGIERLLDARPDLGAALATLSPLHHLFAGSEFLTNWLVSRPEEAGWLLSEGVLYSPRGKKEMSASLAELLKDMEPSKALRRFKHRELCRICARELSGLAGLTETLGEWSDVADIAVDAAIEAAESAALEKYGQPVYTELTDTEKKIARFAALGLGKLGGRELNISSDIDLMFLHTSDNGATSGKHSVAVHEFFVRVAREVKSLLGDVTDEGFVFRVDLDLRPEGEYGEITNSIGAMETYYESWGRQWERQALIKARHCGGDPAQSREMLDRLEPFIYRKYLDQSALGEIAAMKEKIDISLRTKKTVKNTARNIKLGRGGIREIEFIVQALQLLYGAHYTDLKTTSTLGALDICESLGFLSAPHHRDLREAYGFYRRLENRIQYDENRQTHSLPAGRDKLAILGRLMGFDGGDEAARLEKEVDRRRVRVRAIFDLFFEKKEGEEQEPANAFPVSLEDEEATVKWLDTLRFDHPTASARALNLLRNGSSFSHPSVKSTQAFDRFGPFLVAEAASTAWPDHVILGFSNFVLARGARDLLYELLDEHRPVIHLLAAIFSSSAHLTAVLLRQPDILDRFLISDPVERPADRKAYRREFSGYGREKSVAKKMAFINAFRLAESLRLGLRRILDIADRFELMKGLTVLAEEYMRAVIAIAQETVGQGEGVTWTLIAGGKLGKNEMNFGSDLDLLAFYDGNNGAASGYLVRLVQEMIRLCGMKTTFGGGYQIDMRLRPEGDSGPLVTSFRAMGEYFTSRGQPWERLALVGARPIAGDGAFGRKVTARMGQFITEPPPGRREAASIAAIREKIAIQKVKHGAVDIKFGRGGLIEIEFICQWLAMGKGAMPPADEPFTISMLRLAGENRWLDRRQLAELERAYILYRSIEDTLRMDREQAVNVIPKNDRILLRRLARSLEAQVSAEGLIDHVTGAMARVRQIYLRFIDPADRLAGRGSG